MGFEDLEDFNDLNELPPFDDDMDDLPNMGGPESGGISRTFKILGALMFIVVLVVVILLVVVALSGGNEISDTDKQRTSIAQANATTQGNYYATLTAIAAAGQASQTAAFGIELTATVTMQARQTQEAGTATQAVIRQTADAASSATAAAQEEATQVAQETSVAATASANALTGQLLLPNQEPFANVPLMLYRDDGDGVFNAGQVTPAPSATEPLASGDNAPSNSNIGPISQTETAIVQKTQAVAPPAAATAPAGAQTLGYGESGQGTLAAGAVSSWTFTGAAGDAVTISAFPGEGSTIDIVLSLVGPDGATPDSGWRVRCQVRRNDQQLLARDGRAVHHPGGHADRDGHVRDYAEHRDAQHWLCSPRVWFRLDRLPALSPGRRGHAHTGTGRYTPGSDNNWSRG